MGESTGRASAKLCENISNVGYKSVSMHTDEIRPVEWPAPIEIINPLGASCIVLLCPHASNHIPAEYHGLGLSSDELQRHIAWDLGAAEVVRLLSTMLDAVAFLGTYSRLLIDLNRPPDSESSVVTRSEATEIPGNSSLTAAERTRRIDRIFSPYHRGIESHLAERRRAGRPTVVVAIHSFTPIYLGRARAWQAGVLFESDARFPRAVIDHLRLSDPTLLVGANVPYAVTPDGDYDLGAYGRHMGNPAIAIEIRQDLLASPSDQEAWAKRLSGSLIPAYLASGSS